MTLSNENAAVHLLALNEKRYLDMSELNLVFQLSNQNLHSSILEQFMVRPGSPISTLIILPADLLGLICNNSCSLALISDPALPSKSLLEGFSTPRATCFGSPSPSSLKTGCLLTSRSADVMRAHLTVSKSCRHSPALAETPAMNNPRKAQMQPKLLTDSIESRHHSC